MVDRESLSPEILALLEDIERFCATHDMPVTTFGRECLNDTAFVHRLREGSDVKFKTAERVRRYMSEYRPARPIRRGNARAAA